MSFKKITMYTVQCDRCGGTSGDKSEYAGWTTKEGAMVDATVLCGFVEIDDKHYCNDCTEWNDDESELIPKKEEL